MRLFIAALFLSSEFVQSKPRKLRRPPIQHLAAESRIVGGTQATPGEYPFFVEWSGCGASLIHDDIILSAAHCNPLSNNKVVIGAYKSDSLQEGAETRSIVARRSHPAYNDYSVENDFLVMKLNETVSSSVNVTKTRFPNERCLLTTRFSF
jgi:secreted trypsin-like serine protease